MKAVLIADDEPSICLLVHDILEESGLTVLQASDGREVLDALLESPVAVNLAILDYAMPGMDCAALIHEIRRINRQIKIIISSGEPSDLFKDPESLGIVAFLPKPYSMREMTRLVHAELGKPPIETCE
jgi:two-component system cell cycle sensor histidine kinase/response regulator CckA